MHDGAELSWKFVGFDINCDNPWLDVRLSIAIPSLFESPSGYHCRQCPLKSPTLMIMK